MAVMGQVRASVMGCFGGGGSFNDPITSLANGIQFGVLGNPLTQFPLAVFAFS